MNTIETNVALGVDPDEHGLASVRNTGGPSGSSRRQRKRLSQPNRSRSEASVRDGRHNVRRRVAGPDLGMWRVVGRTGPHFSGGPNVGKVDISMHSISDDFMQITGIL